MENKCVPSVFHPNALMSGIWCGGHVKYDIPQRSRLRDLPVNTSSLRLLWWDLTDIDNEIFDYPEAKISVSMSHPELLTVQKLRVYHEVLLTNCFGSPSIGFHLHRECMGSHLNVLSSASV